MYKQPLLALIGWLFAVTAIAQQFPVSGTKISNTDQFKSRADSLQIKLDKARAEYFKQELAQVPKPPVYVKAKMKSQKLSGGCTVKAGFTPGNDTTLYAGQAISFTNTSQNADSYEWFQNVYFRFTTTDLPDIVPAVGITPIVLVAHKGDCTDTAISYIVRNGTPPADPKRINVSYGLPIHSQWVSCMVADKTDGYLLAGLSGDYTANWYTSPYLVRVSETGCVKWSRLLPAGIKMSVQDVTATYDGGFVMNIVTGDDFDQSYLLKLDKNGNTMWSRRYNGNNAMRAADNIKEMADHSLMIFSVDPATLHNPLITHLTETGDFLRQKFYDFGDINFTRFRDMVEKNGFMYLTANLHYISDVPSNSFTEYPCLFKADITTGAILWTKAYPSFGKFYHNSNIQFYKDGLILSGFADSLINIPNNRYSNFETLLETDIDGNLRDSRLFMNPTILDGPIGNSLIVDENNNLELFFSGTEFIDLQPGSSQQSFYLRLDANKNILWQQVYFGYLIPQLGQAVAAPQKGLAMVGERFDPLNDPIYSLGQHLLMIKVDSNGTANDPLCDEYTSSISVQPMNIVPYNPFMPVITDQLLQVVDQHLPVTAPNTELRYHCPDYVPLCSYMKLSGKNFVCNLNDTLEFIAHKDPSCSDPVSWTYNQTNIKTTYQDGSKTRIIFKTSGIYSILAEKPFPCSDIRDSIIVIVAPGLIDFNLGNDTTLCAGDSLVLRPSGKYDGYLWQDGSTFDSFKIKTDGVYHLTVTDSCGNAKSDTIQVTFQTSVPIDLGPAKFICPSEKLFINPPSQFATYDWEPKYDMAVSSVGGGIIVFPEVDTIYSLTVSNGSGCRGFAQIAVHLYPTIKPLLGNDTAVCNGDHLVLSGKGNFTTYNWSDGETTSTIVVQNAGSYSVITMDANKCKTSDTVELTVYPIPVVHILGGTAICKDQTLLLDAGPGFASYSWQNGNSSQVFSASDTGYYRVQVSDIHQCMAADSIHILMYVESPAHFLPGDTSVCTNGDLMIQSAGSFVQYRWSTGETTPYIKVKTSGSYSLQVMDAQGCRGFDSIFVTSKDCDALLVFPNAFTPNNDGLNDVFRLRYPGIVLNYQLQVFNRWGQLIFRSSDPYAGWDGFFSGQPQPAGTYIWMVKYTNRNGKSQMTKGTVVLVR